MLTKFQNPLARSSRELRRSLRELAAKLPSRVAASKADLPLLKLGTYGAEKTAKGSLRSNANMLTIEGVEGDYDGERVSAADAAERLREADLAAVIYTSPSHRPDKPRWRVLCPTSRPLPPADRTKLMARLNGALNGILSAESFTASQTYFYGRVEGRPAPLVELLDGRPIDKARDLDSGALDKRGLPYGEAEEPEADAADDDAELLAEPDVERIARALAVIPADERDTWITVGQTLHNEFGGDEEGFELWDEWSQSSGKYDDADQRRVWESFGSYGGKPRTIGTLYRLAKSHQPKARKFGELHFLSTEDCQTAPSRGYVVKGLIAPGDVACIFGAPGAGKSLIAPHISYQVALGEPAFGMRTKPGVTLYVAAEDSHGMQNRVAALAIRQGHAPLFRVVDGVSDLFADDSPDLDALAEAVEEERPALIVIDTLAMAFPGLEENDAASMGRVVAVTRQLAEHGAAVILIHHDTKAEGSTPRGHSILNGALDMALHVKKDEEIVRGRLTKNRNGSADRDIAFRIGTEELGEDEDGDPITAALAEELSGPEAARTKKMPASQREALAILEELEADGAVRNEEWANACAEGFRVSESENPKLRRDAFNRARRALKQGGRIAIDSSGHVRSASHIGAEVTSIFDDDPEEAPASFHKSGKGKPYKRR